MQCLNTVTLNIKVFLRGLRQSGKGRSRRELFESKKKVGVTAHHVSKISHNVREQIVP